MEGCLSTAMISKEALAANFYVLSMHIPGYTAEDMSQYPSFEPEVSRTSRKSTVLSTSAYGTCFMYQVTKDTELSSWFCKLELFVRYFACASL
jgi:hypothetical protein